MQYALGHSHTREAIHARLESGPRSNYFRDWIYGGIDGAVTTFAIVAGVAGADLAAAVVLVLGFASVLADGLAMAASNYIGTKAERDDYDRVLGIERKHIALVPGGEREEIRQIFAAKGFSGRRPRTDCRRDYVRSCALGKDNGGGGIRSFADAAIACPRRTQHFRSVHCVRSRTACRLPFSRRIPVVRPCSWRDLLRRRRHQKPMVAGSVVAIWPRNLTHRLERGRRRVRCRLRH